MNMIPVGWGTPVRRYEDGSEQIWDCYKPDVQLAPYKEPSKGKSGGATLNSERMIWIEIETDPFRVLYKLAKLVFFSKIKGFPKPGTLIFGIPPFDEVKKSHFIMYIKRQGESLSLKDVPQEFARAIRDLNEIIGINDLRVYIVNEREIVRFL